MPLKRICISLVHQYSAIRLVGKRPHRRRKKELNFSTFATYEPLRQAKKLKKSAHEIEEGKMPLESYLLIHQDAKLTPEQKQNYRRISFLSKK